MDDDASDQVRLQLPMYIGMRYGFTPEGMIGARVIPPNRIHISVDVRMQGAVKKITSPTHPTVVISPNKPEQITRTAQYTSEDFLTQDFVLIVTADGLDAPRCFAQRAPNGTIAMQLSIVPKFKLPLMPQQEYIFLVDRSGSMSGQRIETAKRALVMLLRALPSQGTWFNIFSFGSSWTSLWPDSVPYDERSMSQAVSASCSLVFNLVRLCLTFNNTNIQTKLVDGMDADYGGTELGNALVKAFQTRKTDIPSAVFVLTDGEVRNTLSLSALNFVANNDLSPAIQYRPDNRSRGGGSEAGRDERTCARLHARHRRNHVVSIVRRDSKGRKRHMPHGHYGGDHHRQMLAARPC